LPVSVFQQQKVRYQFAYNLYLRHGIRRFSKGLTTKVNFKVGNIIYLIDKAGKSTAGRSIRPPFCQNSTVNNTWGWHVTYQKQLLKKQAS